MITKKRLTELMRKEETIYVLGVGAIRADKLYYNSHHKHYICIDENGTHVVMLENIFETLSDLFDYEEFCDITKTEKLKLPQYEEFIKQERQIRFKNNGLNYRCATDLKNIMIVEIFGSSGKTIFLKPLTKENYIEACRICKNKFLE